MDFTTLQTELFARGHDELNDGGTGLARAKRWINEAMHEINGMTNWPYLETTASGTAPLTVATVRQVLTVTDNTNDANLQWLSRDQLERFVPDFADTGDPSYYYFSSPTRYRSTRLTRRRRLRFCTSRMPRTSLRVRTPPTCPLAITG